jgi:hypothetical protein
MNRYKALVLIPGLFLLSACHSRTQKEQEVPPLGYYATRAEAQEFADRASADLAKSRAEEKAQGIAENGLPCGHYVVTTTKDSDGHVWWGVKLDKTGCPATRALPNPLALPQNGGKNR